MQIVTCIPCQFGQHDEHTPIVEHALPGMLGGAECHCKGECVENASAKPSFPDTQQASDE